MIAGAASVDEAIAQLVNADVLVFSVNHANFGTPEFQRALNAFADAGHGCRGYACDAMGRGLIADLRQAPRGLRVLTRGARMFAGAKLALLRWLKPATGR